MCQWPFAWRRQFPQGKPEWDGWRFLFNAQHEPYDYLVVFDELPSYCHKIKCPIHNVIYVSFEPPTIRPYYHPYYECFLHQFAWVVTQYEYMGLDHPSPIFHHGGIPWYIGWRVGKAANEYARRTNAMSFAKLKTLFDKPKRKLLSVISSDKRMNFDHVKRNAFVRKLKEHYGDKIDLYGRGFKTMNDKLEALRDYRFHITLESSKFNHYFTEKFADCVIAGSYPLYYGCPNLGEYVPQHSFTHIDIDDFAGSVRIIDKAMAGNYDKKYRAELKQARDLVMHKHNLFPMLIALITKMEQGVYGAPHTPYFFKNKIMNIKASRKVLWAKDSMRNVTLWKYLLKDKYHSLLKRKS